MTLEGARSTARGMVERFGGVFIIYRFPGWPADCWGVMRERDLPDNATISERVTDAPPVPIPAAQGELF